MRVAILTELYLPHIGGQELHFAELAAALRRREHEVHVLCIGHDRGLASEEFLDGVLVRRFPRVKDYRTSRVPGMPRKLLPILRYSWWCNRTLRRDAPFDLHIFNQFPFGHLLSAPARVRRRSVVDWCEYRSSRIYLLLQRLVPRLSALNVGVSRGVASQIAALSGKPVEYLPGGVVRDRYSSQAPERRAGLLYIGRLRPHKRLPLLVQAFGELRRNGFTEGLTIAGEGPSISPIEAEMARLDRDARQAVHLVGAVAEQDKRRLLSSASVLVIPSKREGFPRIVAEAMASGLPVVTTDDPDNGTAEVVREFDIGLACGPNPGELARAIGNVRASWGRFSANGLRGVADLDWDVLAGRIELMASSLDRTNGDGRSQPFPRGRPSS